MQIHLLMDSYFDLPTDTFLPGEKGIFTGASKSLLVITEKEKILVDTGFGSYPDLPKYKEVKKSANIHRDKGQGIRLQLKKHNLDPEDITLVVNTHLHTAHSGNNKLFTKAKFYVTGDEFRFIDSSFEEDPTTTAYVPENFGGVDYIKTRQQRFKIEDGITVVPTPGHTPGHQSVIIECDDDTLVYCGDVSPLRKNLERRQPMQSFDPRLTLKAMGELLKVKNAKWIFSHDPNQLSLRSAYDINKARKEKKIPQG